jgi:hypothetical protein
VSVYEIVAIATLAAAGGYAYFLYRSDTRPKPGAPQGPAAQDEPDKLMFGRDRGTGPDAR